MIKWKCERHDDAPKPVEVVSETECFATIKERWRWAVGEDTFTTSRVKKEGVIFDSFEDAKSALIEDAKNRVKYAEAELDRAKSRLKKRNDAKKPAQPSDEAMG